MRIMAVIAITLALTVTMFSVRAQNAGGPPPVQGGGPGGVARGQGGLRLLPPGTQDQLNLTADQQKQAADLEADLKAKLEKILTPEQQQQLQNMRPAQGQGRSGNANPVANPNTLSPRPEGQQQGQNNIGGNTATSKAGFALRSAEVADGGTLPKTYTGEGEGVTPPLEWSGAPAGTTNYALIMHHTDAQGETFSYWILYNIPADVHRLAKDVKGIGTLGISSRGNHAGYTPPNSAGPGAKTYILTVYALSAAPQFTVLPSQVSHEVLLAAMKDKILASADLSVTYTHFTLAAANQGAGADTVSGSVQPPNQPAQARPVSSSGQRGGQGPGATPGFGRSRLSLALDADGDGVLSTQEMENATKVLQALDKNGDGKLTADELDDPAETGQVGPDGRARPAGGPLMRVLDTDHDGALSAQELANAPVALKAADGNQDGKLTREEVDAIGGGGGGRGGGGNRGGSPPTPAAQGQPDGRGAGGGGGRGGAAMAENKLPTSPNPGQTIGLFLNTAKAYNGYTLLAPKHNTVTYLIDNQGQIDNQWKSNCEPGQSAYLLPQWPSATCRHGPGAGRYGWRRGRTHRRIRLGWQIGLGIRTRHS